MADAENQNTEVKAKKIDVPLQWKEFLYSLEEVRHRRGAISEERDWFKLNPLEILFLGCESVIQNDCVSQQLGTIVIGLENITPMLHNSPRIFGWITDTLFAILQQEKCSVYMWQKCWKTIIGIEQKTKENLRLRIPMQRALWKEVGECKTESQDQPLEIRQKVEEISNVLNQLQISGKEQFMELGFQERQGSFIPIQLQQISEKYEFQDFKTFWEELRVFDFVCSLLEKVTDQEQLIFDTINLALLLFEVKQASNCNREKIDDADLTTHCMEEESITDIISTTFDDCKVTMNELLNIHAEKSELPTKIIKTVYAYLCHESLEGICLQKVWQQIGFTERMEALMEFSFSESYLDAAPEIFANILEFMMSSIDANIPPSKASLICLPNILTPGCKDGKLMCKALEYGSLALRSKHQKSLLGEGLWYMQKCQSLFKSATNVREHIMKCDLRIEAVSAALAVIEELLSSATTHQESMLSDESDDKAEFTSRNEEVNFNQSMQEEQHEFLEFNQNPPIDSETANETDQDKTEKILLLMYEIACCTIKNGENTSYTFASIIPSLFNPSYLPDIPGSLPASYFREFQTRKSHITWKINKTELAVKTLSLCVKCMTFGSSSTFQLCSVMIPKLARNLDRTELTDAEKLNALLEFLETCDSKAETKEAVNGLVTHGLDLISMLMPKGLDVVELKQFLPMMLRCLDKILNSTSLLFLRNSCDFFVVNFPEESEKIKDLFLKLLQKGKKNDIRNIHLLSAPWIQESRFRFVLHSLFEFTGGVLKSKQLQCICEIIPCIVDIENRLITDITTQPTTHEDGNTINLVQKLTEPIITSLTNSLSNKTFDQETQKSILERVSNLTLYKALFKEEFVKEITESKDFVLDVDAKIPADVRGNATIMSLLQLTARRLEHMQMPRYQALKAVLVDILKVYLYLRDEDGIEELDQGNVLNDDEKVLEGNVMENVGTEPELTQVPKQSNEIRQQRVESYLRKMPQNQRLYDRLLNSGYSNMLWKDGIQITVQTNGSLNIEENLRQTLLASFNEYVDLLKQLGIPVIKLEGKDVKIHEVFSDDLTITDLKGRRAVVIKVIDKQLSRNQQPRIHGRKLQLLSYEERIETEMEAKALTKLKQKSFKAKVNISFLDCAACCGPQIIGCYAPNGDHCERPLEIGMRCDSAFASIYDENNVEIENAEMLFMDQGVYIYRAYSNGHPYDTSQVWIDFFEDLLEKRMVVPSIILAHHMPNRHTWEAIRRIVPTVLTGTILSCDFDFTTEWRSYYDNRPESVRCGKDIILIKGFKSSTARPELQRQFSAQMSKDLGGMIFDDVMQGMMQDEILNEFRFLGGSIAEYISDLIETGIANEAIISDHFNFDRWKVKYIKIHKAEPTSKAKIIQSIRELVQRIVNDFVWKVDLEEMFDNRRKQFFQLKKFAEKRNGSLIKATREMARILKKNIEVLPIDALPMNVQEEVMHWIFGNEDRVWRYRGGRDGYETIDQYLRFLPHLRNGDPKAERMLAFPGVIAVVERHGHLAKELIQARDIAAYSVGEYVKDFDREEQVKSKKAEVETSPEYYEIVTAWVNQDYRKLGLSTRIYLEIFKSVKSPYVAFDVIEGSVAKVIDSSPIFKILQSTLPMTTVVQTQEKSYQVDTSSVEEQFERLVVRRRPVSAAVHLYEAGIFSSTWLRNKYFVFLPISFCMVAIILYVCLM